MMMMMMMVNDDDDDDAVVSCKTIPYHVTFHARIFECNDLTCHVSVMTMLVHAFLLMPWLILNHLFQLPSFSCHGLCLAVMIMCVS